MSDTNFPGWHGTTIIGVRKGAQVVVAGDGQVSIGPTVIKGSARKVRRLSPGGNDVVVGFAGSTADAFTLLERLEAKLEATPGQLQRACVDDARAVVEYGKCVMIGADAMFRGDGVVAEEPRVEQSCGNARGAVGDAAWIAQHGVDALFSKLPGHRGATQSCAVHRHCRGG